jgi:hypothetical protein
MPASVNIMPVQKWYALPENYPLFMIPKLIHRRLSSSMQFTVGIIKRPKPLGLAAHPMQGVYVETQF